MEEYTEMLRPIFGFMRENGWLAFCIYIGIGFVLAAILRRISRTFQRNKHLPMQVVKLVEKALETLLWCFVLVQALRSIGVDVVSILGAAGVVGVAIGFASQTALSNLISGIFIVSERSFKLGDYVRIGDLECTVEDISLLSVKLRKVDNALVRIPCETVIKSPATNITGDVMRRCDLDVGVEYSSDLILVRETILEVIDEEPKLLSTPAPVVQFQSFADSAVVLHIGAWCKTGDYHTVKLLLADALLKAFRARGINIPFPTVTISK